MQRQATRDQRRAAQLSKGPTRTDLFLYSYARTHATHIHKHIHGKYVLDSGGIFVSDCDKEVRCKVRLLFIAAMPGTGGHVKET